jgi:hypothetical protein
MSQAARHRLPLPEPEPIALYYYASYEVTIEAELPPAPDFSAAEHAFFASGDALAHDTAAWAADSFEDLDGPGTSPSGHRGPTRRLAAV